jgi:hypothetical protein
MHTRQWPGVRPWADFLGSFYAERYNLQSQTLQLTLLTLPQFVMVPSRNLHHMRGGTEIAVRGRGGSLVGCSGDRFAPADRVSVGWG